MADENDININIGANPAGVEAGSRRAKAAVKGVTDESKGLDAAFRRLKSSIDPTFAATERYNKVLADNKRLLDAGRISQEMYAKGADAAYQALQRETAAIQSNSAAAKAAAAEMKARKAGEAAANRAATQAAVQEARAKVAAERQASRDAAAAVKQRLAEEKALVREAAAAAKLAAREKVTAERAAQREMAAAAREAAAVTKQAAREKSQAERQASREAAEAEKQAKREMKQAAREAAQVAAQAARAKRDAERAAAQTARLAAAETEKLAKAERMAAAAADDLRASIDPAFAAQSRYNATMQRATQLLMTNKLRTGEWVAIQRQAKAQMDLNVRSLGRQNAMMVQLGYQAQDVTASLASGINPLVILAQQGGQTAAAMSTMGGTVGRVASFMAGPWGAAIIGFTMVLGYLWQSADEGKKKTLDLNDAESRRTATVKELTAALRDYVAQQREANNTAMENLRISNNQNYVDTLRLQGEVTKAQTALNEAQAEYNRLMSQPMATGRGLEAQLGQRAAALANVTAAQTALTTAQKSSETADRAWAESRIAVASATAEATAEDIKHQKNLQTVMDTYRAAGNSAVAYQAMLAELRKENERYTEAKRKESEARRENASAAREEARATYQSRTDAIGDAGKALRKKGFDISGNNQFRPTSGHANDADHNRNAIDVNIPGFGANNPESSDAAAREKMTKEVLAYQAAGFRVLWNGRVYEPHGGGPGVEIPQPRNAKGDWKHKSHAHIYAPADIVGKPSGMGVGNSLANEQLQAEQQAAQDRMQAALAEFEFKKELNREDLAEVLRIQDEKIVAIRAFYGEGSREAIDAMRERIRLERSQSEDSLKIARENLDQKLKMAEAAAEREANLQNIARGGEGDVVDFASGEGLISEQQAIAAKAAILNQEYQAQLTHEQKMYSLRANFIRDSLALANLPLEARRALNNQLETLEAEHLARVQGMQANHARAVNQVQMQSASVSLNKWRDVASGMTQALGSALQGLWTRSITVQQAFINMADQMVYKMFDMGTKMLQDWVMKQFGMTAAQQAAEAARTASTAAATTAQTGIVAGGQAAQTGVKAAGAATETGIIAATTTAKVVAEGVKTGAALTGAAAQTGAAAAAGMTEIGTSAAVAAAGAYKSTVVIPFIGPVAAPAAAALALAAVLGFGAMISARGGQGEVSQDGQLTQLHKKEMVLPAWIAEPLRQGIVSARGNSSPLFGQAAAAGTAARGSSFSQGDSNFHYSPTHNNQNTSLDQLLRSEGRTMRRWFDNQLRNGALSPAGRSRR